MENKRILVSYGDDKFSYEVENPESLQEMTIDNNKFLTYSKMIKVMLILISGIVYWLTLLTLKFTIRPLFLMDKN